jgi:uncharacterized protein (DUF58 family)
MKGPGTSLVPQSRLLFWFAVIALPFSVLGAVYPEAGLVSWCLILGLLAAAVLDAGRAGHQLDGVRIELPALVRFSKDRAASLPVVIHNESGRALRLRLGLGLPADLPSPEEDRVVLLPGGTDRSQLDWPCQPRRRGRLEVQRAYLEAASPFGFWAVRRSVAAPCEVRVYPNLQSERNRLAALFLNRGIFGLHAQRQVGKGREFEKLREYVPGDGYDEIHWKATARRGHPITKVFQIERTQEVYVIVDTSRLSARAVDGAVRPRRTDGLAPDASHEPGRTTILERFLASALIVGQAAEHQGDLFGVITFADQIQTFLRARNGKDHYNACRDALYTIEAQPSAPDFDEIAFFIRTRLRRRALLMFLTSLDDPVLAEAFARNMHLLAGQHLVLVNMIQPPDASPLFTRPGVETMDDLYRHLGGHLQWHSLRELEKVLQRRGVRFSLLNNERFATDLVSQYVSVKQRQLL